MVLRYRFEGKLFESIAKVINVRLLLAHTGHKAAWIPPAATAENRAVITIFLIDSYWHKTAFDFLN
ncbi:MAG: hypothetical protein A3H31_00585 [Gallionellales bacterium RIFCSPLOWO2_02_FULL_57_47]|nr:MAG: hypothetical protein A3H31_00585 [Gallionellales bacterium RIFCSPLOWO2_02_FULL_57_47]